MFNVHDVTSFITTTPKTCRLILDQIQSNCVPKKRGNPNWGKGEVNTLPSAGASSCEDLVKKLCLSPVEYESSIQLKEWVRKNKDQKYVPLNLLRMGLGG